MTDTYEKKFKTEKEEIAHWEQCFKSCEQQRKPYEEQWYLNIAFYFSRQYVVWQRSTQGNRLLDPPTPRNRVRLVSNRIKPVIRNELVKLTKEEPQFYVIPNTTEPTDVAAARVGESVADYILKTGHFNRVRRQSTFWSLLCGTSFVKVTCSDVDADILLEKVTSFHMFVPNLEDEDLQSQPFVMHCRGMSPDILEEKYKVKITPDMNMAENSVEQKFFSSLGIKNKDADHSKMVYVKEIWVKPCEYYPTGALLVIAGGKMVYRYEGTGQVIEESTDEYISPNAPVGVNNDLPFEHGEYPFAKINHTASGRFYGISTIEDLISLQKELNKNRSQVIECKNRMAKPQMTYVKGSIDVTKITSEVGLYIPVAPGFDPPQPIIIPPLSNVFAEVDKNILEDIDVIAATNQITRGTVPTGIEAASAIAYLSEQNDSQIYNTVVSIEEATEEIGKQCLKLVQQFWTEDKIIKVVSKNNAFEATVFKISTLKDNTDIRVEAGSMAPKSLAARQAFITDLMTKGLIPPEKGLRYLQMSETSRLYDELQIDSKHAQRENFKMSQGMMLEPNDWDNDETHIYEHELYMKSQEFEMSDPVIQNIFIQHLTMTKMKVMQYVGNAESSGDTSVSDGDSEPAYAGNGTEA